MGGLLIAPFEINRHRVEDVYILVFKDPEDPFMKGRKTKVLGLLDSYVDGLQDKID